MEAYEHALDQFTDQVIVLWEKQSNEKEGNGEEKNEDKKGL